MIIRKLLVTVEDTLLEMGRPVTPPVRRAVAMAVIENPFAGRYFDDLSELIETGEKLGALLAERAIAVLGIPGDQIHSFGKAAIVGEAGEMEHAAAILHPKFGAPVRAALGKGPAHARRDPGLPGAHHRGASAAPGGRPDGGRDRRPGRAPLDRDPTANMSGSIRIGQA
jgi:hypothetical protein